MGSFIRRHWLAYIIGAAVAILLGLGVSYFLGVKWSTPDSVRQERVQKEQQDETAADDMAALTDGSSGSGDNQ